MGAVPPAKVAKLLRQMTRPELPAPATLTDRLRALSKRIREVTILPSLANDLDDMIEEVKLLDDDRRRAKANAKGGSGNNVTPLRRG